MLQVKCPEGNDSSSMSNPENKNQALGYRGLFMESD